MYNMLRVQPQIKEVVFNLSPLFKNPISLVFNKQFSNVDLFA